ncbi:MAG: ABC transporter substrate-binding protein [Candidatus Eisenbacteria bacterium]|nr:ABC transporter substrate-binding protein [Candidatus Eisenbacteria bacterium]
MQGKPDQRNARGLTTALAGVAVLLAPLGCAKQVQEIKVGEYSSLTGDKATFGISTHNGIQMALDELNAAGGIGGVQVRLITEDDQGKPEEAATAVQKLVSQDQVVAVLGEVASSNSLQGAPICQKNGVPMITPASTNEKVTQQGDYIFRVCFIDPFQGTVMAKFAAQSLNLKRVGILRDARSDYSIGLANSFKETFASLGGEISGDEAYQQGDVDFKGPLTALIATGPEALFVPGYYTEVGLIARQVRELGFSGPLLGGDGWDSPKLVEIGGEAMNGHYFSNHYTEQDPSPVIQGFIQKYKAKYNQVPDAMGALSYDAARVLFAALQQVQAASPEEWKGLLATGAAKPEARRAAMAALRDRIAATSSFPGVTGAITLDEQRNARKPAVVLSIKEGKYAFVEQIAP